ncbi:MAG: phospho-N-acetylmuramoyl-pentapeptide-transferase [Microcystis sp.]|uniref:phospho-N-acetylmuramoyl-pentapeptide- transferase n=1 Tax=Microcystis sp. TaxID=1127 RepID=UPI00391C1E5E
MNANIFSAPIFKKPTGTHLLILLTGLLFLLVVFFQSTNSLLFPLMATTLISGGLGCQVVPMLRRLKMGQIMREDGPQAHLKKAGTPTMGGSFFVPVALIFALIWSKFTPNVVAVALLTFVYMGIGWLDDWQILRYKSNKGLSPRMKLILQIAGAVLFCLWMLVNQVSTDITLWGRLVIPLGFFFWILAAFVLVAESNATNLTDGVDGLAGGTGAIAFLGLGIIIAPSHPDLAIFCTCFSGACLGFIFHNRNPAKVFMGDTGSLALGGALAAVGLITGHLWGLFLISGLFFLESLSVIAQVIYYKATKGPDGKGKRLLKMAPFHHHLELSGWTETKIVGAFYLVNAVLVVLAIWSS